MLLLRRLWCPLPLSASSCLSGRPLDPSGHHRAACPCAGVLGRREFSMESAAARVCREAGGRVTTNVRVQDLDHGLPMFHGAQLAIDTVSVAQGWISAPAVRNLGWRCNGPSPRMERAHLSQTCAGSRKGAFGGGGLRGPESPSLFSTCWLTQRCGTSQRTSGRRSSAQQQELLRCPSKDTALLASTVWPSSAEVVRYHQHEVQLSFFGTPPDAHFLQHLPSTKKKRVGPRRVRGPKNSRFLSLSRHMFLSFFLSWGSFRGILVVFQSAGALKCAREEFSGCRVKPGRPKSRCRSRIVGNASPQPQPSVCQRHPSSRAADVTRKCRVLSQRHRTTTGGQPAASCSSWQMRKKAGEATRTANRALPRSC